jgi:UDP-N-acetylmuramoylalanine-D-glutamate ligase
MLYSIKEYSFDVGIRTNFAPDHLNRHPSMQEYFNAKQQLFAHSTINYTTTDIYEKLTEQAIKDKTHIYNQEYDLTTTHIFVIRYHHCEWNEIILVIILSKAKNLMSESWMTILKKLYLP